MKTTDKIYCKYCKSYKYYKGYGFCESKNNGLDYAGDIKILFCHIKNKNKNCTDFRQKPKWYFLWII